MWTQIQYALIYGWIKLHALLPMSALYVLSDFLYFIVYRVIRYRVSVVRRNLKAAFPGKSNKELLLLEKKFYHHFADYVVETLKLAHISLEELQKRAYVQNPELIDQLMDKGNPCCLLLMGHFGNWEWYSGSTSRFKDACLYQIYRPLNNKAVDKLFIHLRTKFGSFGIPKNDTGREVVRLVRNKVRSAVIFLADQTPSPSNLHYWTNFLNQDTAILTGAERLARKLNTPVVFLDVQAICAKQMADCGNNVDEIFTMLKKKSENSFSFLAPMDFKQLARSGRLSPVASKMASILKIKALLYLKEDGSCVDKYAISRTETKLIKLIVEKFKQAQVNADDYRIYISHGDNIIMANKVKEFLKDIFKDIEVYVSELPAVLTCHGGIGCIALHYVHKM